MRGWQGACLGPYARRGRHRRVRPAGRASGPLVPGSLGRVPGAERGSAVSNRFRRRIGTAMVPASFDFCVANLNPLSFDGLYEQRRGARGVRSRAFARREVPRCGSAETGDCQLRGSPRRRPLVVVTDRSNAPASPRLRVRAPCGPGTYPRPRSDPPRGRFVANASALLVARRGVVLPEVGTGLVPMQRRLRARPALTPGLREIQSRAVGSI